MSHVYDVMAPPRPVLTVGRTLVVVAIAIGAGVAVAGVGIGLISLAATAPDSGSSQTWDALGRTLLGFGLAVAGGVVTMVTVVGLGLRGRARGGVFTLLFAITLVGVPVLLNLAGGPLNSLGLHPFGRDFFLGVAGFFPLLWVVPAAVVRVIRWWWLPVAIAGILVVLGVSSAVESLRETREQDQLNTEYDGLVYAPSTSPESPLAGYVLTRASLPGAYEDYEGAERISFSYLRQGSPADGLHDDTYRIGIAGLTDDHWCNDARSSCEAIGDALGVPVMYEPLSHTFEVVIDDGVITVDGNLSAEEAIAVFADLRSATLDDIAALEKRSVY